MSPLKEFGLASIENGTVKITETGRLFLKDEFDSGNIFFRILLKWQIPSGKNKRNNELYNIKPFVGSLHLIDVVNKKEIARGNNAKGISRKEFSLFVPTLIHYRDIETYADKIVALRDELKGKPNQDKDEIENTFSRKFAADFLGSDNINDIKKLLKNLRDYGDNAIRYFRLTRYLHIRGGGYYIDLEPRRPVEISHLLNYDNAQSRTFKSEKEHLTHIADPLEPKLPWETTAEFITIIEELIEQIEKYQDPLQRNDIEIRDYTTMQDDELKGYIIDLRKYRRELQDEENRVKSQTADQIEWYIASLKTIFDFDERPILLEKLSSLGLLALNDALKIQANHPVGDDNQPIWTAPANVPDIECFYESFNAICEVTMLTTRDQWYNEGQPVMRHLRDFERKYGDKPSYCLFISPKLHRDTINTFWTAIKYEYEGQPLKIIPLSIANFISVLEVLLELKAKNIFLRHQEILHLYDDILVSSHSCDNSNVWIQKIPDIISNWTRSLIPQK